MYYYKFRTVRESFEKMVEEVIRNGNDIYDEQGRRCRELLNVVIEITNPNIELVSNKYVFGKVMINKYIEHLLNGTENEFSYDYHSRLFEYSNNKINQIDYIVKKLVEEYNSRRAIAITWNPEIDCSIGMEKSGSVPCLQYINFQLRNRELYMMVLFRSNDLLVAYHSNALGLIKLGKMVARKIGETLNSEIRLKNYIHFVNNMHIYIDRDKDVLKKYFDYIER